MACDGSVYSAVPLQVLPVYRTNVTLPLRGLPPDVIVAESFGSQFCAVPTDVVSVIVKHSSCVASLEPV
jgi:hypothetical protein